MTSDEGAAWACEKGVEADLLREMVGTAAQRPDGAGCGEAYRAGYGERSVSGLAQPKATAHRWKIRAGHLFKAGATA